MISVQLTQAIEWGAIWAWARFWAWAPFRPRWPAIARFGAATTAAFSCVVAGVGRFIAVGGSGRAESGRELFAIQPLVLVSVSSSQQAAEKSLVVVWHLAGGNLSVVVGIEVVEDRLGVLSRRLPPVVGSSLVRGGGIAGNSFRNRWLRHRFGGLVVFSSSLGRQQQRASGYYQQDRASHESVS